MASEFQSFRSLGLKAVVAASLPIVSQVENDSQEFHVG